MKHTYRYWGVALILVMVTIHAAIIWYVRSRVAQLNTPTTAVVEIGEFRIQPVTDPSRIYHFHLHAVVDPAKLLRGKELLTLRRMEIVEASEQMLRQFDPVWLDDPLQAHLRERLMNVVLEHLHEPLVQRVLITNWLQLPVESVELGDLNSELASY